MASRIIDPRFLLSDVRTDGIIASKRDREAVGIISCFEEGDDFVAIKRYKFHSISGGYSLYDTLEQVFLHAYDLLYSYLEVGKDCYKIMKSGRRFALLSYHSHPMGSWSNRDLKSLKVLYESPQYSLVALLYRADTDEFQALDSNLTEIVVVRR